MEGSSIYQIGGQPGHRSEEHVFVLKSIIVRQRAQGKQVIIQPSEIQIYFYKEMIEEVYLTGLKRVANPKLVRLWYKLNDSTRIRVRTGAGLSDYADAGAIVGQGTIGGALGSQAVLDECISEYFSHGTVAMASLLLQDDLNNSYLSVEAARMSNIKIYEMVNRLNLNLQKDKTSCFFIGSKKKKKIKQFNN